MHVCVPRAFTVCIYESLLSEEKQALDMKIFGGVVFPLF